MKVLEELLRNVNLGDWSAIEGDDCLYKCGGKGGACDYCNSGSQNGFCCRKDGEGGNENCPAFAIHSLPNTPHHICMIRNPGKL